MRIVIFPHALLNAFCVCFCLVDVVLRRLWRDNIRKEEVYRVIEPLANARQTSADVMPDGGQNILVVITFLFGNLSHQVLRLGQVYTVRVERVAALVLQTVFLPNGVVCLIQPFFFCVV